ncbi:MAG: hypothetical protein FWD28_08195 [Treponema sp.]|nr:hypothetical protein [Treponema sp.]
MDRIGNLLLYIAVALYLFANGILGFSNGGDFHTMSSAIFSGNIVGIVTTILSVIGLIAGVLLLLQLFRIAIPNIELLMLIVIIVWVVFMVIVDIIHPLGSKPNLLAYLVQLATHLMVLGALISASKSA